MGRTSYLSLQGIEAGKRILMIEIDATNVYSMTLSPHPMTMHPPSCYLRVPPLAALPTLASGRRFAMATEGGHGARHVRQQQVYARHEP